MVTAENKIYAPFLWPYRLVGNLILLIIIWFVSFGVVTIRHNLVGQQIDSLMSELYDKTATVGWGLDDVTLEGRNKTSKEEILRATGLKRGDNILEADLKNIYNKIKSLPWIREASITRRYFPNVIHIAVKEKKVKSIWQYQNEFYPIDEEGKIIETEYVLEDNILQIVGLEAPNNINKLLQVMEKDEDLFARVKVANFISKRRWNLIFDDVLSGVTVKLPEENVEEAWKKLVKLEKTRGILKRKLTFIDLRLKNKVIVKISNDTD